MGLRLGQALCECRLAQRSCHDSVHFICGQENSFRRVGGEGEQGGGEGGGGRGALDNIVGLDFGLD